MAEKTAAPTPAKKLYLSSTDRKLVGLCGGLAAYFEFDSSLIRLAWIIFTVVTGLIPGLLAYVIATIVIPKEPTEEARHATT